MLPLHLLRASAMLVALTAAAMAQDGFRTWGGQRYDSAAFALPTTSIAAADASVALTRSDGRIFVLGGGGLVDPPPPPANVTYTQLLLAGDVGFGVRSDGQIISWGANGGVPAPPLPTGVSYVQADAHGSYYGPHAIALRSDGSVVAWGSNVYGQGNVPALPPGVTVTKVATGAGASAVLLSNGTIQAFGSATGGLTAVPALPPGVTYVDLWGGPSEFIAARSDGAYVGWGTNYYGVLSIPALPATVTYRSFAIGTTHAVALRSDGAVVAWGSNYNGQTTVPTLPPGAVPVQVAAGDSFSLLLLGTGEFLAFGRQWFEPPPSLPAGGYGLDATAHGYLLDTTGQILALPWAGSGAAPPLPAGMTYLAVTACTTHAAALRSDGRAVAWGVNAHSQLAIPPLPPGLTYTDVDADFGKTVMLRSDGAAVQAGYGGPNVLQPPPGTRFAVLSIHRLRTVLLRSDGVVLLNGTPVSGSTLPPGVRYVDVAAPRYFVAALRSDGEIDTFGLNLNYPFPPLPPGVVYVDIDPAEDDLVARRSDGTVVAASPSPHGSWLLAAPDPEPGTSFCQVDGGYSFAAVRVGPTRTYVTFANGCAGTMPAARLVPRDTPFVGGTFEVNVFDLPNSAAIMAFGWTRTAPTSLAGFGLPGCMQHIAVVAVQPIFGQLNTATWELPIPDLPGLVGLHFVNQAIVLDPQANAAGAVVSAAAEGVIGRR